MTTMIRLGTPGGGAILRDWLLDDLPLWERWLDPANDWYRTDAPFDPPPSPDEIGEQVGRLRRQIIDGSLPTPRTSLVIADATTGRLMGRVNRYWQDRHGEWLSVGIAIYDPTRRGRGIGFEALVLWTDYLFGAFPGIVRLDIRTWSGNAGMIRLAEKLGYIREACFRDARLVDGAHHDALGYGILRAEWEAGGLGGRINQRTG